MESFLETGLSQELLDAIEDLGFIKPTPIQAETILFYFQVIKML